MRKFRPRRRPLATRRPLQTETEWRSILGFLKVIPLFPFISIRNGGFVLLSALFFRKFRSRASWSFSKDRRIIWDYLVFLAVSGKENRADLVGWEKGLRLTLSSNCAGKRKMQDVALICGAGKDPYAVTEEAVKWALKLSGKNLKLRREKEFPEILRKLGWCSWDSLGQSVKMDAGVDKVKELKEKEVPVQWVLIDDGWSDSEGQMLKSFEADPVKFPGGIKETVSMLKEVYTMKYVGVWQAIKGYWNGILPGSQAEKENAAFLTTYPNGEITVKPQADAVFGFWNQWHAFLENAGVDFIKVDSQSSFSIMTQGTVSYGEAAKAVHTGLEASADLHFNRNLINCTGGYLEPAERGALKKQR